MTRSGDGLAVQLAAVGTGVGRVLSPDPLDSDLWDRLIVRASRERMEGMLAAAVGSGALPVTDDQLEQVRSAARGRARTDLLLEQESLEVADILAASGVAYRLIKGPALAHTAYPDPSWRSFGDVDILVSPSDWYKALDCMSRWGAVRRLPELRRNFDIRFGKDATFVSSSGWEIDLHRTLVVGPYGLWVDCDELFARPPATVSVGGRHIDVLDPDAAFVYACYNTALADDPPRLAALRDVSQLAMGDSVDADATFGLARRWNGVGVVRRAISLASGTLGLPVDDTAVGRRFAGEIHFRDRLLLACYRGPGRGYTSQLAGVVAVPRLRAKAAYLFALTRPQRAYLDARGFSGAGFIHYAVQKVTRRR